MKNEDVGYKNPPKKGQFKKGSSGNPKGRPKGRKTKDIGYLLEKELNSNLQLKDGSKITKGEAIIKKTINNLLQTDDISKTKSTLDLISKIEDKRNGRVLSEEFLKRLVNEKYIDMEDAKDFAKGRKDPNLNFPRAIFNLSHNMARKDTRAWEAVKEVEFLGIIYDILQNIASLQILDASATGEYNFWKKIDEDFESDFDFTKEQAKEVMELFKKARRFARPSEELLVIIQKMLEVERNNLLFFLFKERDKLMKLSMYDENAKIYLDNDRVEEKIRAIKTDEFSEEQLLSARASLISNYKNFTSVKYDGKVIEVLDVLSSEQLEMLLTWTRTEHEPELTKEEATNAITKLYFGE